jgi:hypothetical protein
VARWRQYVSGRDGPRGYIDGVEQSYLANQATEDRPGAATSGALPINIDTRFRYNQPFKSVNAEVPLGASSARFANSLTILRRVPSGNLEFKKNSGRIQ